MTAADLIDTTLLGRYRVVKKLGQGGMGAVYEARHEKLGKRVAIKVLLDRHASNTDIAQRFEQEARLASAIGDSHIIDVADIGQTDDGRTCIVMELLDGASLAQLLVREPDISEARIAGLVAQAARALAAAHAKGIIHRDIKPENLFVLDRDGDFVKVVDFGISKLVGGGDAGDPKLTGTGMVIGTAAYMSPEQARGDDIDERVDVYALGVVMYEAATGRVPFTGDNYLKVLGQIVSDEPKPLRELRPAISERFERICLKAMAKRREDRYASASELAAALDSSRTGAETAPTVAMPAATSIATEPTMASPSPAVPVAAPTGAPRRISPRFVGAIALAAAVASIAIVAIARRGGGSSTTDDRIDVAIETDPQGAAILQGDKVLGYTPMKYRFLLENKVIELSAQMPGYDIACFVVNPAEEKLKDKQLVKIRMPDAGSTQNCLLKR